MSSGSFCKAEFTSEYFMHLQLHRIPFPRAFRQRQDAVEPERIRMPGFEAHHGAEVIERGIDILATPKPRHHLGRAVAHAARVDLDQRARITLDGVARVDVE